MEYNLAKKYEKIIFRYNDFINNVIISNYRWL